MYINTQTLQYPVSEADIRAEYPNTSFPVPFVPPEHYEPVLEGPVPAYDAITHYHVEVQPGKAGGVWMRHYEVLAIEPEIIAERIASHRHRMLAAVNAACDAKLKELAQSYPDGEVKSWPTQVAEAEALRKGPDAATPLLSAVAAARGVPLDVLAERVLAKAHAYAAASGAIIGHRQALEDQLDAAGNDLAALRAINIKDGWPA